MACCSCCTVNVRIGVAAVGISAGLMAGLCFLLMYHNYSTTIMAFVSSIFATLALYLHLAYKKGWMASWSSSLFKFIFYSNAILFVFAIAGMITCFVLAGIWHQNLTHQGLQRENLWMTSVWCFMTSKWTGMCTWSSRFYAAQIRKPLSMSPPIHSRNGSVEKDEEGQREYF